MLSAVSIAVAVHDSKAVGVLTCVVRTLLGVIWGECWSVERVVVASTAVQTVPTIIV